jgi:hypothetical protein
MSMRHERTLMFQALRLACFSVIAGQLFVIGFAQLELVVARLLTRGACSEQICEEKLSIYDTCPLY